MGAFFLLNLEIAAYKEATYNENTGDVIEPFVIVYIHEPFPFCRPQTHIPGSRKIIAPRKGN